MTGREINGKLNCSGAVSVMSGEMDVLVFISSSWKQTVKSGDPRERLCSSSCSGCVGVGHLRFRVSDTSSSVCVCDSVVSSTPTTTRLE